jgi:putative nucleotidyltransferase with HDIG domain
MKSNITELVRGVSSLVTLPDVFIRINQLVEDPDSTTADIAKVISQDPSFSIRLLRVANSPFYGFPSAVDSISNAVSIIGTNQIRNMALATSVASTFDGLPNDLVSMEHFWKHSLYCALAARILAKQARSYDPDVMFTAALLHDIGELIIFNRLPENAKDALLMVLESGDEIPVYRAEQKIIGFDHAQVGGELAREWKLPNMLEECIEFHHNIRAAQRFPREVALVHIANVIALMSELGTLSTEDVSPIDPLAWSIVGLNADEAIQVTVDEARTAIIEAEELFLGK